MDKTKMMDLHVWLNQATDEFEVVVIDQNVELNTLKKLEMFNEVKKELDYIQEKEKRMEKNKITEINLLSDWYPDDFIYKYKNRIKLYRGEHDPITLFYDLSYTMFADVGDIANYAGMNPEDALYKVSDLLEHRLDQK